jgi:hypothetical protein
LKTLATTTTYNYNYVQLPPLTDSDDFRGCSRIHIHGD